MVDLKITLPDHFLDEETRDGYFVSSDMKKVWAVELDLLAEFRRVCDKYGLHWYADGGTMLGAVRHKGFIPWDNDIDISMPRKDYDLLCSVAPAEFCEAYFFQTYKSDEFYFRLHAQLRNSNTTGIQYRELNRKLKFNQGVCIDIFPFDSVPDSEEDLSMFVTHLIDKYAELCHHNELTFEFQDPESLHIFDRIKAVLKHIRELIKYGGIGHSKQLIADLDVFRQTFNSSDTTRVANLSLPYYTTEHQNYFLKEWYSETKYLPFENTSLPVPAGYVDYLNVLYGDWHKYVVSGALHGDTLFDLDKPYSYYLKSVKK